MITMILAADLAWGIGNKNNKFGLPWEPIREDLIHYKKTTTGGFTVMGPATYNIIGKPLPNRTTVVMSRKLTKSPHPDVLLCNSPLDVKKKIGMDFFVCGGAGVYDSFAPLADKIILTKIHATHKADCFFHDYIMSEFVEQPNTSKILREATDLLPLVTVHYYERVSAIYV